MRSSHQQFVIKRSMLTAIAVLMLLFVNTGHTQDVANGQATATILAVLSVTAAQALQFGNVFQGVMKSQDETSDANSGIFSITGAVSSGISIFLSLPEYLALADGSDRLAVAFGATDAAIDSNNTTPGTVVAGDGWVDQDPHNIPAATVIGAGGQTNVYLGGKVIPSVNQSSGAYSGDVVVSVAYNGS